MNGADSLRICGLALLCAVAVCVVKKVNSGFEVQVRIASAVVFLSLALGLMLPVADLAFELLEKSPLFEWQGVIFGALGIALMTYVASDLCTQLGESSIAGFAELCGKLEILLLCIPLIKELLWEVEKLAL